MKMTYDEARQYIKEASKPAVTSGTFLHAGIMQAFGKSAG